MPSHGSRASIRVVLELLAATLSLLIAPYYSIQTRAAVVDPDIWWHIRVGDWITSHGSVPRAGIFSQYADRPWVAYSWLFDVLVSSVNRVYGLVGIVGLLICFQVLVSLVFVVAVRRVARGTLWVWPVAAAAIYAFYINPLRPALFTLLFFTVQLFIIFEAERRRDDGLLWWMGPLFVFWANSHLQFVYGMCVLVLYVLARKAQPRMVALLALAVVCSCLGPNGWLPYRVALEYAGSIAHYQVIQELGPLSFRRPEHFAQLLLLMAACVVLGRSARLDPFRSLLVGVTAVVSFRAMRDSWFVSIASAFVIAEGLGSSRSLGASHDVPPLIRPSVLYALAAALSLVVSFGLATRQGLSTRDLVAVIERIYPLGATEFVKQSRLEGPMYNDFNWGGFLMYRLPEHPVSIDPRADLYGHQIFARAQATARAEGWQSDPDVARANFLLIPRWYPLAAGLARDRRFRLIYQDHVAAVFARAVPAQ